MWVPEVKEHCPTTPYILVGMKCDLRDEFEEHAEELKSKGMEPISTSTGEEMKAKIGAYDYVECSALKQYHLKEVFESAIKIVLHPPAAAAPAKKSSDGGCCEMV
ncbi:Ras-related C3 botulinum toxin substrate 1 [Histomonas meleagridis]|nr:Ras-related C3 botulinum toxin substrate 1 [Histomonas meleagridis]KAH0796546.1 Ras-related C3 botulinum toxin substrate 1 [Histomonas meleagridis]